MKIPLFSIEKKLLTLLLCIPLNGHSQVINGSFGRTTHFYERCSSYEEEIKKESFEVAWRGERISKAIVIWAERKTEENISFRISNFNASDGTALSGSARLSSVEYVRADLESKPCGGHSDRDPDHYLELGDVLSTSLDPIINPSCPSVYWLSMDIPATSKPGQYNGTIEVCSSGKVELELQLSIQVVEYSLPPVDHWSFHLDLWQFPAAVVDRYNETHPGQPITYWSDEHFGLLQKKYRLLGDMGQKVITAHIKEGALGSPSMVQWIMQTDSSWVYDFKVFERYVESFMSWGISKQISCQSPVGWNSDVIPYWCESTGTMKELCAPIGTELYAERWNHFLGEFRAYLDERGWFNKAILYLDEVEPEKLTWIIKFIKANHPDWKIGLAGFHTPTDFVDANVFDLSLMVGYEGNPKRQDHNGRTTFYTSCSPPRPNNFIAGDADPATNIWIGWHAQQLDVQGFLRWAFDYWTVIDPMEQRIGGFTSGDFSLSYRSSNEPDMEFYPSVRLELLREGIEDFEKIIILKKKLKESGIPADFIKYQRLLRKVDEFNMASGESKEVSQLVDGAQQLLKEIVTNSK